MQRALQVRQLLWRTKTEQCCKSLNGFNWVELELLKSYTNASLIMTDEQHMQNTHSPIVCYWIVGIKPYYWGVLGILRDIWYLHSYPGSKRAGSAWQPGDRWPGRSPASPAPWWLAPTAAPGPHRTEGTSRGLLTHTLCQSVLVLWWTHLSFRVAVAVFVLVSQWKLHREMNLDLLIRHLFTHTLGEGNKVKQAV